MSSSSAADFVLVEQWYLERKGKGFYLGVSSVRLVS